MPTDNDTTDLESAVDELTRLVEDLAERVEEVEHQQYTDYHAEVAKDIRDDYLDE